MSEAFNQSWFTDVEDTGDEQRVQSPNYSLSSQINSRRIGSAIPILHGTHKITPDFAAQPYTEAIGGADGSDPSITHAIYALGLGEIDIVGADDDAKNAETFSLGTIQLMI